MSDRVRWTLDELFSRQDAAVATNRSGLGSILPALERALSVAFDATYQLSASEDLRDAPPAKRIVANVLNSAWSGLVSATRLALSGDHVGAFTLLRLAFEDTYHAEYFRLHPEAAEEWDAAGRLGDMNERRLYLERFARAHSVRKTLERLDDPNATRTWLFSMLSSYGSHTTPATTVMRIGRDPKRAPNLGFVSTGMRDANRVVAGYALHIGAYMVGEFAESFGELLTPDLLADCSEVQKSVDATREELPERWPFQAPEQ
ncbi:MAG: hypothetical protein AB7F65_02370 [Dehalococcoidia bacterium]